MSKYVHDSWCHAVIENEQCSCYVSLLESKDAENARLREQLAAMQHDLAAHKEELEYVNHLLDDAHVVNGWLARDANEASKQLAQARRDYLRLEAIVRYVDRKRYVTEWPFGSINLAAFDNMVDELRDAQKRRLR